MESLLEIIREEASRATWSLGVRLARTGTLQGKRSAQGDLEVRIATQAGMMSPLVVLSLEHEDWSCECTSGETVCQHVAAAIITLHQADKEGRDLLGIKGPGASVHYAFTEQDGELSLRRMLNRQGELTPLRERLTSPREQNRARLADVAATRRDLEIDILLGNQAMDRLPSPFVPKLLALLEESEQVSLDGRPVEVGPPRQPLQIEVRDHKAGFEVVASQAGLSGRRFKNGAVAVDGTLCPLAEPLSQRDIAELYKGKRYRYDQVADLVGRVLPKLRERLPVTVVSKVLPTAQPMPPRLCLNTENAEGQVRVLATLVYGDPPSARVDAGRMTFLGGPLPLRDAAGEERLYRSLKHTTGLELGRSSILDATQAVCLAQQLQTLDDVHFVGEGLSAFREHGPLVPSVNLQQDGSFVRFQTADGREASPDAVLQAFRQDSPLVALSDGGFAELPRDWLARHGHILLDLLAAEASTHQTPGLSPAAAWELARLCQALDHPPPPALQGVHKLLRAGDEPNLESEACSLPNDLTATLRDYQREGVAWLQKLRRAGMGALLGDDMGLGKTLQTLCAIEAPTLVVCPASVLFNWRAELERFRPSLRVQTYHGAQRKLDPKAHVTLTTYALLRLDREALSTQEWRCLVLDEAHTIKNPQSQVSQAACSMPADWRVALTGTPVENRLEDLWSQMHFLNRGLLGGRKDFQERYAQPIAAGDANTAKRLRTRIGPLLLRRLKREVAAELPPRTDLVLRFSLDERERALYEGVQAAARAQVVRELEGGQSPLAALEALLRLRQACCHPALLPGQKADDSSKLRLLRSTLEEVISEGHKVLVFSQWTQLLDLLEPGLNKLQLKFVRLDGSTKDRGAVVEQFQQDEGTQLMLLSLKAGGVGLNLTAADHVFLLDPWWNPAVEDQAADRAHRIGQDRPVFVHRLVAERSVEERILDLQNHKRSLADAAMAGSASPSLTKDDLLALLEG